MRAPGPPPSIAPAFIRILERCLRVRTLRLSAACAAALVLLASAAGAQIQLPAPVGHVNDFAHVIPPEQAARMEAVIEQVRERSRGEIVVVTLPSLQGHSRDEVALQIGREWKVGNAGEVGDTLRGTGTVILVVPSEHQWKIEVGTRTSTFVTAAQAGQIGREQMVPAFRAGDFGTGILNGVTAVAQRYAEHGGFSIGDAPAGPKISPAMAAQAARDAAAPEQADGYRMWIVFMLFVVAGAAFFAYLGRSPGKDSPYAIPRRQAKGQRTAYRQPGDGGPDYFSSPSLSSDPGGGLFGGSTEDDAQRRSASYDPTPSFDFGSSSSDSGGSTDFGGGGDFSGGGSGGDW
jgi:uncharacterized protein